MQPILLMFLEFFVGIAVGIPRRWCIGGVDPKQLMLMILCEFPGSHETV